MPQATPPGSTFRYASTTLDLLAEALERRLGRPFDDIVPREHPGAARDDADHVDPRPDPDAPLAPVRVDLAALAGVPAEALLAAYTRLRLAGGGLWSTADDVLRLGGRSCAAASSTASGCCRRHSWSW